VRVVSFTAASGLTIAAGHSGAIAERTGRSNGPREAFPASWASDDEDACRYQVLAKCSIVS